MAKESEANATHYNVRDADPSKKVKICVHDDAVVTICLWPSQSRVEKILHDAMNKCIMK